MPIEPVTNQPGLWRDPAWTPHMPGLYATVVGISNYPHLGGGQGTRAADTFGLGQLDGSARTAARVFRWLRHGYRRDKLPVVWCQLLLAPTPAFAAELAAEGLTHYLEPTYARLRDAIDEWTGFVPQQPAAAAGASRTLLFYSGHGVQSAWWPQLLPADYLDPGQGLKPKLQNCIDVEELHRWINQCPVGEHLALIDACRNQFSPLASMGARATSGFPAVPAGNTPRTAALLSSTSADHVAFQVPGQPLTVFGQALVEAIEGTAPDGDTTLDWRDLVDYVKPRVNYLLREAGSTQVQDVRPRVEGDDRMVITERVPPAAPAATTAGVRRRRAGTPPGPRLPGRLPPEFLPPPAAAFAPSLLGPKGLERTRALAERTRAALPTNEEPIALEALRSSFEQAHQRMGHETTSALWLGPKAVRLHTLADGRALTGGATVRAVARDERSNLVHVDLSLEPQPGGVLLVFQAEGSVQRKRLGVALPTDDSHPVPVRLSLHLAPGPDGGPPQLQGLTARLGPDPGNDHYAYLWSLCQQARLNSLTEAAEEADVGRLQQALDRARRHPTAAVAGALLLIRARRFDRLGDWPKRLCEALPTTPDTAVILAAAVHAHLQQPALAADARAALVNQLLDALDLLLERGVPYFSDVLDLADELVQFALRLDAPAARQRRLQTLASAIGKVFQLATPGGDFIVLPGLPRPTWMPGRGALAVREMLGVLRGPAAQQAG
jgi:hypothetical protein